MSSRSLPRRPRCARAFALLLPLLSAAADARADMIVNPPLPIRYQVNVQIIQSAEDDGSPAATVFGNATQRAAIESRINAVWAQAGIRVAFADRINPLYSSLAYSQSGNLPTILAEARDAGVLATDPNTINLVMVRRPPGFALPGPGPSTVAGFANIGGNGIAEYVGENLLNSANGWDAVADVTAHEIGHNLGLIHLEQGGDNLMSPNNTAAYLNPLQIATVVNSDFVLELSDLPGDFTGDGSVDLADYTHWRNRLGTVYTKQDYAVWRANYGRTSSNLTNRALAAPEPAAAALLCVATLGLIRRFRKPVRNARSS